MRNHEKDIPHIFYTRIEHPELNRFLLSLLNPAAGGIGMREKFGR